MAREGLQSYTYDFIVKIINLLAKITISFSVGDNLNFLIVIFDLEKNNDVEIFQILTLQFKIWICKNI